MQNIQDKMSEVLGPKDGMDLRVQVCFILVTFYQYFIKLFYIFIVMA